MEGTLGDCEANTGAMHWPYDPAQVVGVAAPEKH